VLADAATVRRVRNRRSFVHVWYRVGLQSWQVGQAITKLESRVSVSRVVHGGVAERSGVGESIRCVLVNLFARLRRRCRAR